MRPAKDTDFFIELEDVGTFRFGRRTFRDRATIRSLVLNYTKEFGDEDSELLAYASVMAVYKVLVVDAPKGWEAIDDLDLTEENDKHVFQLFGLLSDKEEEFRQKPKLGSETEGEVTS